MRGIKFVFLVAVAIAGLTLSTGVGASTGKGSAPAKVSGAHIQKVIVNGSAQKYAQVPERVKQILKRAAEIPGRTCPNATSSSPASDTANQTCTWGTPTTPFTGPVTCIQVSTKATAVQTCDVTQASAGANNTALIIQIIWSQNPPSGQDGTQIVKLRQTNTSLSNANNSGGNRAGISQYIRQSLGRGTPDDTDEGENEPDAPATLIPPQKQESHQTVHLRQDSIVGANNAPILQFLRQRERASNSATTNQDQNIDLGSEHPASLCLNDPGSDNLPSSVVVDPNANQCILSNQTSVSGTQSLGLGGDYNQFQRARKARYGHQVQGNPFIGGSDYGLIQNSTGVSSVLTIQNERQVQRGIQVGTPVDFVQSQNGPRKGSGSAQLGNSADNTWTGRQTSTQIQTRTPLLSYMRVAEGPSNGQTNILVYSAHQANGTMDVKQTATQNNGTPVTNSCSSSPCEIAIVCAAGESCAPTPNCTEGGVIDPTTGECISPCTECCTYCYAPGPGLAFLRYSTAAQRVYAHRR